VLHGADEVLLTVTENQGQQNLWNHFESAHQIRSFPTTERKALKGGKKQSNEDEVKAVAAVG
jgi:hypothetical protein